MKKRKFKLHAAAVYYIDPTTCDSTVGYRIYDRYYAGIGATVVLADCDRKIEWGFSGTKKELPKRIKKIDAAIGALLEFRVALKRVARRPSARRLQPTVPAPL